MLLLALVLFLCSSLSVASEVAHKEPRDLPTFHLQQSGCTLQYESHQDEEEVECFPGLFNNGSQCLCGKYPGNVIYCNGRYYHFNSELQLYDF